MRRFWMGTAALFVCLIMLFGVLPHEARAEEHFLEIDRQYFPDEAFLNWIVTHLPVVRENDGSYYMTEKNVNAVKRIACDYCEIGSLRGIEYFPMLEELDCGFNQLTELDVSRNSRLKMLCCTANQLTELVLGSNLSMTSLYCDSNKMTTVDLSGIPYLMHLECDGNRLTELDVEHNTLLDYLSCGNNRLSALDVTCNARLKMLLCAGNELTELNVAKNKMLNELHCDSNPLGMLDVGSNPELKTLTCSNTPLGTIDVSNNPKLEVLILTDSELNELDVGNNPALQRLVCRNNRLTVLDVGNNTKLTELSCNGNRIAELDVRMLPELYYLDCSRNGMTKLLLGEKEQINTIRCYENVLTEIDVRGCINLEDLLCDSNRLTELDLGANTKLHTLSCSDNALTRLDLSGNTSLWEVQCAGNALTELRICESERIGVVGCRDNRLAWLDVRGMPGMQSLSPGGQAIPDQTGTVCNGIYTYDMTQIVPKEQLPNVRLCDDACRLDDETGIVTFPQQVESFRYIFSTGFAYEEDRPMDVTVQLSFIEIAAIDGVVEWNDEDVEFKGATPYVIADGTEKTPRFTVRNSADGSVIDPADYDYEYRENTNAGTGYVIVTFKGAYSGTAQGWFKIYLPATTETYVENVGSGIKITWKPVEGAAGYVIYRRAWSSKTNGWTDFVRWNNVTETSWIDGSDETHKVYAGSRYQYGVKAYFARRVDPVSGATIGGNVGDNFNLGMVGPLKTTVRITTRKLVQVRSGNKELTVKWEPSRNFTGYQIQYATDAEFTQNAQVIKIADPQTYWTTLKDLRANTTYYVRIRSYHEFEGMTYFGEWSNVLTGKTN